MTIEEIRRVHKQERAFPIDEISGRQAHNHRGVLLAELAALRDESDRLEIIEQAAEETYLWLKRNNLHLTGHGQMLAAALSEEGENDAGNG